MSGQAMKTLKQVGSVAIFLLGLLLIFGNLAGNLGFTEGTLADNESAEVIEDLTSATTNVSDKFGSIFTIAGVLILILAVAAMMKVFGFGGGKSKGVFTN
jgi:hypothetical protein